MNAIYFYINKRKISNFYYRRKLEIRKINFTSKWYYRRKITMCEEALRAFSSVNILTLVSKKYNLVHN